VGGGVGVCVCKSLSYDSMLLSEIEHVTLLVFEIGLNETPIIITDCQLKSIFITRNQSPTLDLKY